MDVKTIRANILRWLEALESGRYIQCRGRLRDTQSYCCLGVAANVLYSDNWVSRYGGFEIQFSYKDGIYINFLPKKVAEQFGITGQHDLADLNDGGKNFAEIAQYIRENILVNYPEE